MFSWPQQGAIPGDKKKTDLILENRSQISETSPVSPFIVCPQYLFPGRDARVHPGRLLSGEKYSTVDLSPPDISNDRLWAWVSSRYTLSVNQVFISGHARPRFQQYAVRLRCLLLPHSSNLMQPPGQNELAFCTQSTTTNLPDENIHVWTTFLRSIFSVNLMNFLFGIFRIFALSWSWYLRINNTMYI